MSLNAREALQVVLAQSFRKTRETVAMDANALGRVLASGIRAPQPSPRWDVSAMDGYALRSADFPQAYGKPLLVAGSQFAGQRALTLRKGQALAVMTGALIPTGADAVLPKERARVADNKLYVETSADVQKGDHIRCAGEELKRGAAVAKSGTRLSSRWIGFLSGLGIA
ncbi:MAG: molybdopterin molybdenumtransferase MoeA, partial [candidate division FCPU426 bacterium]